jgi:putative flippase GtrA
MHGIFLWRKTPSFDKFYIFISGYSIGLSLNILFVYFFVNFFSNALYAQVIGGALGVVFNFFSSKFSFTKKIAGNTEEEI